MRADRETRVLLVFAGVLATFAPRQSPAADLVLNRDYGLVKASCVRPGKKQLPVCAVVYTKQPYLGFQFGSEDDPESVAVTAGARRVPNSEIEMKVDKNASHSVFGEGFIGKEAEAILGEIENGTRISVTYQSESAKAPITADFNLDDFKTAVRDVQDLRDEQR